MALTVTNGTDKTLQRKLSSRQTPRRKPSVRAEDPPPEETEEKEDRIKTINGVPPIQLWRRMARLVRMLIGVCITLRSYAIEAGFLENYMVNVVRSKGKMGEDVEDLSFNLKDFKIKKEMCVPTAAVDLMEKFPDDRTSSDVATIRRALLSVASFKKYTPHMQDLLSKIVRYMKCGKRRVVLRKGHIGYSLYFIYSGSVSVVLDKDDGNVFVKPEVVILRKGACFGEIALVQNTRRTATIVCAEDCEFLVVDKEDFIENKLNVQMEEELMERFNIFRAWPPFAHWTDDEVMRMSYVSRMEEFKHNRVVVRDSRKNEWLWFIIRGSCDILRLVDLDKSKEFRQTPLGGETNHPFIFNNKRDRRKHQLRHRLGTKRQHSLSTSSASTVATNDGSLGNHAHSTSLTSSSSSIHGSDVAVIVSGVVSVPPVHEEHDHQKRREILNSMGQDSDSDSSDDDMFKNAKVTVVDPEGEDSKKKLFSDIGCGIFVKVDTLRDGQCFGLESLFDIPVTMSLVSQGCQVIHIPRNKFREIADNKTLQGIKNLLRTYPSDAELTHKFLEEDKWDTFKHGVVNDVMTSHHHTNAPFESSLRPSMSDYVRKPSTVSIAAELSPVSNQHQDYTRIKDYSAIANTTINNRLQHVTNKEDRSRSPEISISPYEDQTSSVYSNENTYLVTRLPKKRLCRPKTCPPRMRNSNNSVQRMATLRNFVQENVDQYKLTTRIHGSAAQKPRPFSSTLDRNKTWALQASQQKL